MKKGIISKLLTALLLVGLLFSILPSQQAQAATLDVCPTCTYTTIQAAINAATDGDTIQVGPGTYNEFLMINKPLTVISTGGAANTIISKDSIYVVSIRASDVTFDGFTVMSPGYSGAGADPAGIMIGYYADNNFSNIKVTNNIVTQIGDQNRVVGSGDYPTVGIVVNATINGLEITGNTIHGLTQVVNDNAITYGPTAIGYYGNDKDPRSTNVTISGNTIYNIGTTGTGTNAIANGIRPGYSSGEVSITGNTIYDVEGRGVAVTSANNASPSITGNTISNCDEGVYLANPNGGTITGNTFSGNTTNINVSTTGSVTISGNVTNVVAGGSIQAAIDAAYPGDIINVYPGEYSETAPNSVINAQQGASYTFGLFFDYSKPGITLQGVKADGTVITNPAEVVAKIETVSDANFGPSGIFVDADNITITGLEIGDNYKAGVITNNKAIEVIADGFTFKNNVISTTGGGSLYFGEFAYNGTAETARIKEYTIEGNLFTKNATVDITSGTGVEGLASSRIIKDNTFTADGAPTARAAISFSGDVASIGWFNYPVGGATITGNSFTEIPLPIRSRGTVEDDFDWESYLEDNTFDKAVVAWDPTTNMPRAWSYTSGSYFIDNVRTIGTSIQDEIGHAADGDTVKVLPGTYSEKLTINKPNLTVSSTNGAATTIIDVPDGSLTTGVSISGTNLGTITFEGFTVKNFTASGIVQGMGSGAGTTVHVLNNVVVPAADYLRNGIQVSGNGSTVIGNTVTGAYLTEKWGGTAINVVNASNVTVKGNEILGKTDAAIAVVNYNTSLVSGVLIENNIIHGTDAGIVIQGGPSTEATKVSGITVKGNDLGNSGVGLDIAHVALEGANVFEKNDFSGTTQYINISGDPSTDPAGYPAAMVNGTINASPNWFGTSDGPDPAKFIDTQDEDTFNFVLSTYTPYCTNPECTTFYGPVHNTTKNTYYATIQAAIDAAEAGNVITVAAGTYIENIVINKPLTLQGPNVGVHGTGTRSDEAIVKYVGPGWTGVRVVKDVPGVTVDGFTFDGANLVASAGSYTAGVVSDSSNFTLQNNVFINHKDMAVYTTGVYNDNGWKYDKYLTDILIKDNKITNAMPNTSGYSFGIYLQSSNGTVTGNFITDVGSGIQVQPYWNTIGGGIVTGNTFQAYRTPVYYNYAHNATGDWLFEKNIITGIPLPAGVEDEPFNAIRVEGLKLGNVDFEKNQVTFGGATNAVQYLYFENDVASGTRSASPNWWGAVTGPDLTKYSGDAGYLPYCTNPECTEFNKADLYMTPATTDLACGGTGYVVEVMVKDVYDLQAYELKLQFDQERIEVTKVENGTLLTGEGFASPDNTLGNTDGKLSWGWAANGERKVDGSGSLIKITFKPKVVAGESSFTILNTSELISWPNALNIPFEVTGGATVSTASIVTNTTQNKSYCDLAVAVAQANGGDTLRADVDFTTPGAVTINKALTLNTNGKTITRNGDSVLLVNDGGNLTIDGGGTITTTSGNAILITGSGVSQAKVKLVNATIYGPNASVGVVGNTDPATHATPYPAVFEMTGGATTETVSVRGNGAELIISGGTMTGAAPIMGNGTVSSTINNGGTKITISGDAVIGSETLGWVAVYQPQDGELNINGGTIKGYNGVEIKAGTLNITGGTISAYGAYEALPEKTGNGTTNTGDAILVYSRNGYGTGKTMNVNISGTPTITSANGYALREFTHADETSRLGVATITGGHFTGGTPGAVFFSTNTDANLELTGGDYSTDPIEFVYAPYGTSLHTDTRWYISGLPVLTSTTFDDPVTLGVGSSFTLTVNPSVPGTFNMVFTGYPSETEITYGSTTYTCVGDPCVITVPVTLTGDSQDLIFGLVVATGGTETPSASYAVTATLHAPAPEYGTTGRDLAHLDATVAVTSGFEVTGTFSMQGRTTTIAGIPVTLTWNNAFGVVYGPTMVTTEDAVNFNMAVNYGGSYTLTTLQPRFLNVTADLGKTFDVSGPRLINSLWLRAGNALWQPSAGVYNNVIDVHDASLILNKWGTDGKTTVEVDNLDPILDNSGDVNFDNIVSIKDLTLVGGNMNLTSATAYGTGANVWIP